jgi:ketosteroid isomerase-like protein
MWYGLSKARTFFEAGNPILNPVSGTFVPIGGVYKSNAAFHRETTPLSSTWATPLQLVVQNIVADGDWAVVELKAIGTECKNGLKFANEYAWVCRFNNEGKIDIINAYMDT